MSSTSENFEELLYTQRLADVSDKVRGQTIKKLKTYLRIKSSTTGFTYEDFLKIWKGLYYCMYMADKPLFQEDLAESISKLIHHLSDSSQKLLFFKVALDTFAREWSGIDKFRMDKFLMLVTRVLRQLLIFLCGNSWHEAEIKEASDLLESRIICPFDKTNEKPLGLKMHLSDIILEELAKVGKEALPDEVLITLMFPFLKVLAVSNDKTYVNAIKNRILMALIRQSELGLENQEDLSLRELEVVKDEAEEESVKEEEIELEQDKQNEVMDPRAGGVDVELTLLRPDYNKIAEALEALASLKEVPRRKKDLLRKHGENFLTLAKGKYPFSFPYLEDSAPKAHLIKKALKSLQELENNKPSRKRKVEEEEETEPKKINKTFRKRELEEEEEEEEEETEPKIIMSNLNKKKLKNIKRMEKLKRKNKMRKRRGIVRARYTAT